MACRRIRFGSIYVEGSRRSSLVCCNSRFVGAKMTGGNVINRPKTALQKNLNKLTRVKKAQKKKQQQKGKGVKQSSSQKSVSISAKKKRLIMKQIKKQQREANSMEVVTEQTNKKSQAKVSRGNTAEKMDTS